MAKFKVIQYHLTAKYYEVDADNEDEALEAAHGTDIEPYTETDCGIEDEDIERIEE